MRRAAWAIGAGVLFTGWGALGWAAGAEAPAERPHDVEVYEDGSGTVDGWGFCFAGELCDETAVVLVDAVRCTVDGCEVIR